MQTAKYLTIVSSLNGPSAKFVNVNVRVVCVALADVNFFIDLWYHRSFTNIIIVTSESALCFGIVQLRNTLCIYITALKICLTSQQIILVVGRQNDYSYVLP